MKLNNDGPNAGTFEVDPNEKITFTVQRKYAPCVAGFAGDGWQVDGPVTEPGEVTEVKTCTAPATSGGRCTMSISVSFTPKPAGDDDMYIVIIAGTSGEPATDVFFPPPNINGEVYQFHVR
jgi:hypothetical protein